MHTADRNPNWLKKCKSTQDNWPGAATYKQMLIHYVQVLRHRRNVVAVLDGCGNKNCTKTSIGRLCASKYAAKEITFDFSMKTVTKQDEFLGSESNKTKLIEFLGDEDIQLKQAPADADPPFVSTALEAASKTPNPVVVVAGNRSTIYAC